jgi:low temperature requirement protein LtrA
VNALAIILWGVSLLYLSGADSEVNDRNRMVRFVLWYLSIGIEVLVNMSLQRFKQVSLAASHLAERFGLFTIIILGKQKKKKKRGSHMINILTYISYLLRRKLYWLCKDGI